MLDGKAALVYFNDGDTFKILQGNHKGKKVRIDGFNALETPPIHFWLNSSVEYLHTISSLATQKAQKGFWNCEFLGDEDAYGRFLARCDDLALALIGEGLAHAYSVDENPADEIYLKQQKIAQQRAKGMWAYGIPQNIITSLHSYAEGDSDTYNRLISTEDGHTAKMKHRNSYATCEMVCIEQGNSCMVYVPFKERYGNNRPECLFLEP